MTNLVSAVNLKKVLKVAGMVVLCCPRC